MSRPTAAIDLGGTHVRAALIDPEGTVRQRTRRRTPVDAERPDVLPEMIEELTVPDGIDCVVVGVPGVVDHDANALVAAPNLPPAWTRWLTGAWLEDRIGATVSLANDADLAGVGEAVFGAGRGVRDVVYITVSTGIQIR